jgi:hypothetical protein
MTVSRTRTSILAGGVVVADVFDEVLVAVEVDVEGASGDSRNAADASGSKSSILPASRWGPSRASDALTDASDAASIPAS